MQEKLKTDLRKSMKERQGERTATLRLLMSQIQYAEISRKRKLTENEILALIQKGVRDREEAAALYKKGGREELAEKEIREAEILQAYLPEPLSGPELERAIGELLGELGITEKRQMGQAMKEIMERYRGRIDGAEASRIVASRLQ